MTSTYKERKTRKFWSNADIKALLHSYSNRKEEFLHATKKKTAFQNVLIDLESQDVLDFRDVTAEMLEAKFKSLVKAYKYAKDNAGKTGAGTGYAPFQEEFDEIFGDRPLISHRSVAGFSGIMVPQSALPVSTSECTFVDEEPHSNVSQTITLQVDPVTLQNHSEEPSSTIQAQFNSNNTTPLGLRSALRARKSEREKLFEIKEKSRKDRHAVSEAARDKKFALFMEELAKRDKAFVEDRQRRHDQLRDDNERRHRDIIFHLTKRA